MSVSDRRVSEDFFTRLKAESLLPEEKKNALRVFIQGPNMCL